jgi:GTP-binding protein HflX
VGFIRELPPALRQAFAATLEEIADADVLLHVVDATDPDVDQQIEAVEAILHELGAASVPRFMVYNKCDRLDDEQVEGARARRSGSRIDIKPTFFITALDKGSTRELMRAIEHHLWARGRVDEPPAVEHSEGEDAVVLELPVRERTATGD